jgi:hypothetical protein
VIFRRVRRLIARLFEGRRHDIRDPHTGALYLRRWYLIGGPSHRTRRLGVKIHRIDQPDGAPDLHDHPWPFLSIVLRGAYVELLPDGTTRRVRWINFKRPCDAHRIVALAGGRRVWTFVVTGRASRTWGFRTAGGWVPFDRYAPRTPPPERLLVDAHEYRLKIEPDPADRPERHPRAP